jgi:hypothetical protein
MASTWQIRCDTGFSAVALRALLANPPTNPRLRFVAPGATRWTPAPRAQTYSPSNVETPRTAQAVPLGSASTRPSQVMFLSCEVRKCTCSSTPLTSTQESGVKCAKKKRGKWDRYPVRLFWESATGGAPRFARRHPRLLLLVRFGDSPLYSGRDRDSAASLLRHWRGFASHRAVSTICVSRSPKEKAAVTFPTPSP